MLKKLSFKEYLESKETLRKAIERAVVVETEYVINKYCSLTVGADKTEKERVPLKPNNKVIIEWEYIDVLNPYPLSIRFDGARNKDLYEEHVTYWTSDRLREWLSKNTRERT